MTATSASSAAKAAIEALASAQGRWSARQEAALVCAAVRRALKGAATLKTCALGSPGVEAPRADAVGLSQACRAAPGVEHASDAKALRRGGGGQPTLRRACPT